MSFANQVERKIKGIILKIENAKTKDEGVAIIKEGNVSLKIDRLSEMNEAEATFLKGKYLEAVKSNSDKS